MKTISDRAKHERATKEWQFFLSVYLVRDLEERRSNVLESTLKARLRSNVIRSAGWDFASNVRGIPDRVWSPRFPRVHLKITNFPRLTARKLPVRNSCLPQTASSVPSAFSQTISRHPRAPRIEVPCRETLAANGGRRN